MSSTLHGANAWAKQTKTSTSKNYFELNLQLRSSKQQGASAKILRRERRERRKRCDVRDARDARDARDVRDIQKQFHDDDDDDDEAFDFSPNKPKQAQANKSKP